MEGLFFIVLAFVLYFLPSIAAYNRDCKSSDGILLLNLFLGWTLIGWVVALVWAASGDKVATTVKADSRIRIKCPWCSELILNDAIICKHCNRDVSSEANNV